MAATTETAPKAFKVTNVRTGKSKTFASAFWKGAEKARSAACAFMDEADHAHGSTVTTMQAVWA